MGGAQKNRSETDSVKSVKTSKSIKTERSTVSRGGIPDTDGRDESREPSPSRERGRSRERKAKASKPSEELTASLQKFKNVEIDWRAYAKLSGYTAEKGCFRRGTNKWGKQALIGLNMFPASFSANAREGLYKFDVTITYKNQPEGGIGKAVPRKVQEKVWNSRTLQKFLGGGWIYDGNKLAWGPAYKKGLLTLPVDMNLEEGRQASNAKTGRNIFNVAIKAADEVRGKPAMASFVKLKEMFHAKIDLAGDIEISEALCVLDHIIHQNAKTKNVLVRKSFYPKSSGARADAQSNRLNLRGAVEAAKGIYASFRLVFYGQGNPITPTPVGMAVNADVSNCCFWVSGPLVHVLGQLLNMDEAQISRSFTESTECDRSGIPNVQKWISSSFYMNLKKLRRVRVIYQHAREKGKTDKEHTIKDFIPYGPHTYGFKDKDGNTIKVAKYLRDKYMPKVGNMPLFNAHLPCVEMMDGDIVPVETVVVVPDQRYNHKLNERQTSDMIKFAVELPDVRFAAINQGLSILDWENDPWLKNYGIVINKNRVNTHGRILDCPDILYGAGGKNISSQVVSGRWRIDGKKFVSNNGDAGNALKTWGICVLSDRRGTCVSLQEAKQFADEFVKIYKSHGGIFVNSRPVIVEGQIHLGGKFIEDAYHKIRAGSGEDVQLIFFVVPDKNADTYSRIKKSCDCRYGVASQVMQSTHVKKRQGQYISNICMKVNAKLGGSTSRALGRTELTKKGACALYDGKTMIIGADVSHAAPGSGAGSIAALTVSSVQYFTHYMAKCQTNGHRVEMIQPNVLMTLFSELLEVWMRGNGGKLPERIVYFRDGVSNEQCNKVITEEVRDLQKAMQERAGDKNKMVPMTVVVCTKRHQVRFFPHQSCSDKNHNPIPGTIVENCCTNPVDFDWYLCAHVALKGTARPMHYMCILDQNNLKQEHLQQFIFEHSFQYMRSTTPVSMFPAIYYAHLAAARARPHENAPAKTSGKKGIVERMVKMNVDYVTAQRMIREEKKAQGAAPGSGSGDSNTEVVPLMPVHPTRTKLQEHMWYI